MGDSDRRTDSATAPVPPEGGQPEVRQSGMSCPTQWGKLVPQFCDVIQSTIESLESVVAKVVQVIQGLRCSPSQVEDVELALREALANAILHGNKSDPAKKVIVACFCECEAEAGLLLVVRDEGSGFDPAEVPDPTQAEAIYLGHGRGIFLMRQLMDEVQFQNGGSEVALRKRSRSR